MNGGEVVFEAADGWSIAGVVRAPDGTAPCPGILTVPASTHARDAWTQVGEALAAHGFTVLQIDIRGRGASTGAERYARMGPRQRRRVSLDVAAAVDVLAGHERVDPDRLGLVVEQDTAPTALEAVTGDDRIAAVVAMSPRRPAPTATAVGNMAVPFFGLVSTEDREGLRATVDAYLASPDRNSRLDVFRGVGIGITMASVLQFEKPDEAQVADRVVTWLGDVLGGER